MALVVAPADNIRVASRILINEINSNHESRTPEALARNVVLIRELNSNLLKASGTLSAVNAGNGLTVVKRASLQVVELYRDLSDSVEQGIEASDSAVAPAATQA